MSQNYKHLQPNENEHKGIGSQVNISDSGMKLIDDPVVRDKLLINKTSPCCICPLAKQHRLPFPISTHKSSSIF